MAAQVRGRSSFAPVLLFAAVLLLGALAFAIANLDDSTPLPPLTPDRGSAPFGPFGAQVHPYWIVAIAIIALAAFITVVVVKFRRFGSLIPASEVLLYAIAIGLIVLTIFLWPQVTGELDTLVQGPEEPEPDPGGNAGGAGTAPFGLGALSTVTGLPIALAAFIILAIVVFLISRSPRGFRRRSRAARGIEGAKEELRLEIAAALNRTVLDLEAAGDFRTAVLACYQRMLALLERRGLLGQDVLTAREIEARALTELGLSRESVNTLTALFEEARYSDHPMGPRERSRAVENLNAVRRELGA